MILNCHSDGDGCGSYCWLDLFADSSANRLTTLPLTKVKLQKCEEYQNTFIP